MGVLGPPKPPAPLDVEPRWQQKRHTTWHGKQELRAHNRAFDASQLSKKRAQAQRGPPTPPRVDDKAAVRKARAAAHQRVLEYKKRQQHVPVIQAAPTPQTYDDDSFEFEEAAPTKMPWYSQDRAKRLASKHHKERREAVLRQKEAQRKHRETVEARLERVQQTILRRRRDRQGTFRKGSAVLVEEQPKHEKTLNWKPETAWRPGPYPNPQKTSMARTRLFGPPPADSKKAFRDVVEALKSPTRPPRKIAAAAAGWRKAWSAVREFVRTDPRCVQQRRERLQAQVLLMRERLGMAEAPPPPEVLVKAESVPVSPPEAPRGLRKQPGSPRSQRVRIPGGGGPSFATPKMPASPHRPPTRKPPPPPPPTPPPNPPADASPRDILNRLRQQQPSAMDASAEGSLLRSSRENLPAGAVLGGRPARSAPLVPPAPSREVPAAPSREEPSVDAQVDALADTLDDGDDGDDDDDAAEVSSPRDILARLRSEQPSASAEESLLRRSRDQSDAQQVEALADVLDEDDDAAAAPAPAATDAQQVDQLADILDDDASDMDVFAQGSPRISMGGSSFADESKADDASSSLLESKDFQLHGSGGFDSDA